MSRVLITGIDGFTGRYLAKAVVARGHDVIGMARNQTITHSADVIQTLYAELNDLPALTALMRLARPDHIAHLAAISTVTHENVGAVYETNLVGTRNLLQSIVDAGLTPDAVLLASSANIYGNATEGQIDESAPVQPVNDYGVSKVAVEHIGRIYGDQLPIIIVRPFNYTGVGQTPAFVIPKLVAHARHGTVKIETGNLDVARDFSDVRTVAECYARLLDEPSAIGKTFNVCSGRSYWLRDVVTMIEEIAGIRFEVSINPDFVRQTDLMTLFGSRALLEQTIGRVDMPPLEETLRWMMRA